MPRSIAVVVFIVVLCAFPCSSVALGADVASDCAGGLCLDSGSEEAALLQRKVQEHQQKTKLDDGHKFPDLGGLKDTIKEGVGKLTDTVGDIGVEALTTFAETLNDRLEETQEKVESFSKEVNSSAGDIKKGIAAILATLFNVTIEGAPTAEKYRKKAMDMLAETDVLWSVMAKSVPSIVKTIDSGLSLLGPSTDDLRKEVNATLQGALIGSKGVLESIEAVKKAIEEAQPKDKKAASTEDTDDSLLQTKQDPSSFLDSLNSAIAEASNQASAFAQSFLDSVGMLSKEIADSVQDKLSADDLSKVHKSFQEVQTSATKLAHEVVAASKKILVGLIEASSATAEAAGIKSSAVQQRLALWGLGLSAIMVFDAVSV